MRGSSEEGKGIEARMKRGTEIRETGERRKGKEGRKAGTKEGRKIR